MSGGSLVAKVVVALCSAMFGRSSLTTTQQASFTQLNLQAGIAVFGG
jgi:hypothetical protein